MKQNKFLIALALCAIMQPNISFGAERAKGEVTPQPTAPKTFWQRWVPEGVRNVGSAISERAASAYEKIAGSKGRLLRFGAIVAYLAVAGYNRERVMNFFNEQWDRAENNSLTKFIK